MAGRGKEEREPAKKGKKERVTFHKRAGRRHGRALRLMRRKSMAQATIGGRGISVGRRKGWVMRPRVKLRRVTRVREAPTVAPALPQPTTGLLAPLSRGFYLPLDLLPSGLGPPRIGYHSVLPFDR
jgi:hypothetical protein